MTATSIDTRLDKLERMRTILRPLESVMVAFSGGVDSTFVLKVAHEVLGDKVTALTTTSSIVGERENSTLINKMAPEMTPVS